MAEKAAGVVIAAEGIGEAGEWQDYREFAVTASDDGTGGKVTIDIRLVGQKKDVIWMVDLDDAEAAIRFLKAERKRVGK